MSRLATLASLVLLAPACGNVNLPEARQAGTAQTTAVTVKSPDPVSLWRVEPAAAPICDSPCEAVVAGQGARFEVRVAELPDSPSFEIPRAARVELEVRPSSAALMGAGATFGVLGATGMLVGGLAAGMDAAGSKDFEGALTPGLITLASGSAVLAGGLVFAALAGTEVTLRELATAGTLTF